MKHLTLSILMACNIGCLAQVNQRHAISAELSEFGYLMPAGIFIQYDYMFRHSDHGHWTARAAVGGFGFSDDWNAQSLRANLGYSMGKQMNFLELGVAGAYVNKYYVSRHDGPPLEEHLHAGPQVGYKRINSNGFLFRAYIGMYAGSDPVDFQGGLGLGWAFGRITRQ